MYKGVVPFIILQLIALGVVGVTPQLVNYLPNRISLLSETAPPPRNPRLQHCIEEGLFPLYASQGDKIRAAITTARGLDISMVPSAMRSSLKSSFTKADKTFELIQHIAKGERELEAGEQSYRPLHRKVRLIQRDIRKLKVEQGEIRQQISRSSRDKSVSPAQVADMEGHWKSLKADIDALKARIPANWKPDRKKFVKLQRSDTNARRKYRRNVDGAYEPVQELGQVMNASTVLGAMRDRLFGLDAVIANDAPPIAADKVKKLVRTMNNIAGSNTIRRSLRNVRRALRKRTPDMAKAGTALIAAKKAFENEIAWRKIAVAKLKPGLDRYEAAIRSTIGLRLQPRLPKKEALDVASCLSIHRDQSLKF